MPITHVEGFVIPQPNPDKRLRDNKGTILSPVLEIDEEVVEETDQTELLAMMNRKLTTRLMKPSWTVMPITRGDSNNPPPTPYLDAHSSTPLTSLSPVAMKTLLQWFPAGLQPAVPLRIGSERAAQVARTEIESSTASLALRREEK